MPLPCTQFFPLQLIQPEEIGTKTGDNQTTFTSCLFHLHHKVTDSQSGYRPDANTVHGQGHVALMVPTNSSLSWQPG